MAGYDIFCSDRVSIVAYIPSELAAFGALKTVTSEEVVGEVAI